MKTGLEIARKRRPNVVLATGNPWTSLLVGSALASRLGVPFIADFRDPWLHNPFRTRSPFIDRRIRALEKKTVSSAARVIANTRELQMQFESEYPELRERMLTLTNGFDYPPPISRTGDARSDPELFELCHFGSIYGKRVPRALLDALSIMAERRPFDIHKLRVRFVGQWEVDDPRIEERVSRLEKIGVVKRESRLPHDTCLQMMRTADALLVLQSESNLQIPAKLFEYAWAQRPVLVIGGEGATAQLVTRAGLGVCVPPTVESVSQLIDSLLEQRTVLPTPTADAVQPFHYRALTRQLSQVLDEVVSARD